MERDRGGWSGGFSLPEFALLFLISKVFFFSSLLVQLYCCPTFLTMSFADFPRWRSELYETGAFFALSLVGRGCTETFHCEKLDVGAICGGKCENCVKTTSHRRRQNIKLGGSAATSLGEFEFEAAVGGGKFGLESDGLAGFVYVYGCCM